METREGKKGNGQSPWRGLKKSERTWEGNSKSDSEGFQSFETVANLLPQLAHEVIDPNQIQS